MNPFKYLVQFFVLVWFICGNVWVYRNYEPNYEEPENADYCKKMLYLFAFWVTNSHYIIFALLFIGIIAYWTCQVVMCDKIVIFD